jgi:hypothetical protein
MAPLICIVVFFSCLRNTGQEVTSTSVTTGNPNGIRLVFKKDSTLVSLNGTLEVFASNQIPVPGYSPDPLLKFNLVEAKNIEIEAGSIESIPDSLWPARSIEGDSIRRFNVVISSDSLGLVLKEISLIKSKDGLNFAASGKVLPNIELHSEMIVDLVRLTEYVGKTDTNRLSLGHDYYLFIYGTGYVSKGDHGIFKLSRLPMGQHNAFFFLLPKGESPTAGMDSTAIFSLNGGLDTKVDSLYRGPVYEMVELPDSLKSK